MSKIWSAVATFMILFTLNLWLMDRTNRSLVDIFSPAQNWSEVPIYALSLGTLLAILSSALMLGLIPRRSSRSWVDRVPALWADVADNPGFRRLWKGAILVLVLVFPLAAQVHFWRRFHTWHAWVDDAVVPAKQISLYEPVSLKFIFDWDAHRYGDLTKMSEEGWRGVSYLPLWQPMLMAVLSATWVVLAIIIFRRVFRR